MSLLVDRKVLQSQYSRNNLNIHFKLVSLYVTNLNSLATTSALIAGLSFGCIHEFDYPTKFISTSWRFGYFYSLVSMLALVFAILALSQTTICVIFGPTMFLFGENHSDSLSALQIMKQQQKEGFFWSCACVAMAFLQTLFFEWGVTHFPLACILTVVHLCGYYVIYKQGQKTMRELMPLPTQSSSAQESASSNVSVITGNGHHPTLKDLIKGSLMGHGPIGEPDQSGLTLESAPSAASNFSKAEDIRNVSPPRPSLSLLCPSPDVPQHILQIRRRGYLWTKNANRSYQSDHFVRIYVVLESGELTFYREREVPPSPQTLFFSSLTASVTLHRLHQDAQASLKYANIVDRLPSGMEV
jgi:hypothetical protein